MATIRHPRYAVDDTAIEDAERSGRTIPHIGADGQCQCVCPWCNSGLECICPNCRPFDHEHATSAAAVARG